MTSLLSWFKKLLSPQSATEAYLEQSVDLVDLERRMRDIERADRKESFALQWRRHTR